MQHLGYCGKLPSHSRFLWGLVNLAAQRDAECPLGTTPAPTELLPVHASRSLSRQAETPLFEARRDNLSHAEAQRLLTNCHKVLNPVVAKVLNSVWHFVMP